MNAVRRLRMARGAPILVSAVVALGVLALASPAQAGIGASKASVHHALAKVLGRAKIHGALVETNGAPVPRRSSESAPMFTQCPPVGADTGCGELITVNADGTVTAAVDPSQPPLDNSEEVLLGVVNNSTAVVSSIPLSGNNSFKFDNDGLCTRHGAPAGCPFGPTGYEGPGTSFTFTAPDFNDGSVVLTGGLASGASTYFSLEGQVSPLTNTVSCQPNQLCSDSISVQNTQSAHVSTTSTTSGSLTVSVDQSALDCGDSFLHAPLVTSLTATGITSQRGKVVLLNIVRSQAIGTPGHGFRVCYSSPTPFRDLFGHQVTTGLLPGCTRVANKAPCVISITYSNGIVQEKFVVPSSDPRFH